MIPGNLLFIHRNSIKTINETGSEILAGEVDSELHRNGIGTDARFRGPHGLFIVNRTTIIVADKNNNCFRVLNRITLAVTDFVGHCDYYGPDKIEDGIGDKAKIKQPSRGVLDQEDIHQLLYFTDYRNDALRMVNLQSKYVKTILEFTPSTGASAICWDNVNSNTLIIYTKPHVVRVLLINSTTTELVKNEGLEHFAFTTNIFPVYSDIYITSQYDSTIYLMDLGSNVRHALMSFEDQAINAVLLAGNKLYVSLWRSILVVPGW